VLTFRPARGGPSIGLPSGCRLELPTRSATLPDADVRFLAPTDGTAELLVAERAPNGTVSAGILPASTDRRPVRPFPWSELDAPPAHAHAKSGWLAALTVEQPGTLDALVLWREGHAVEQLAEGDQLSAWDARCADDDCVVLSTRVSRSTGSGATVFRGPYRASASRYRRVDIQPTGPEHYGPLAIVGVRPDRADVALSRESEVTLFRVKGDGAASVASWKGVRHAYTVLGTPDPTLIEAGRPFGGACTGQRFPLVFRSASGEKVETLVPTAPASLAAHPIGEGYLVVWVGPMSCRDTQHFVINALLADARGRPVSSPMAVTRGIGFAMTTRGDTVDLWLHLGDSLAWARGRCPAAAAAPPAPSVPPPAGSAFKSGAK
jgi:hypothetical protein